MIKSEIICPFCKTFLIQKENELIFECTCKNASMNSSQTQLSLNPFFGDATYRYELLYNVETESTYLKEYEDIYKPWWTFNNNIFKVSFDLRNKSIDEIEIFIARILRRKNII